LNYGERDEYSETPHVEFAAGEHRRHRRRVAVIWDAPAHFLVKPALASIHAARRADGSKFSTAVGDNCAQVFVNV